MVNAELNPLRIDYSRFTPEEIEDTTKRRKVNGLLRRMRGLHALAFILLADSVEVDAQDEPQCLDSNTRMGLLEAMLALSADGENDAEALGILLKDVKKGDKRG